jgi:hypothetical protein
MRTYVTLRNVAIAVSGAVLVALALSGSAKAITDTVFKYSTPKTGFLAIPAAAFSPYTDTDEYYNNGDYLYPTTGGGACFKAPVNLPAGAKMTALAMWYLKGDTDTFTISFVREKLSDSTLINIVYEVPVSTGGVRKSANYDITDASLQTVDSQRYIYLIEVCLGNSTAPTLYAVRIAYTYTNAGD